MGISSNDYETCSRRNHLSQSGRHSKLKYRIVPRPLCGARIVRYPGGHPILACFSKNISST
jgi:hypothetical protein